MKPKDLILKICYCLLVSIAGALIVLAETWSEILGWTLIGIFSSIKLIK